MSHSNLLSTLYSSDHDFIAALRFMDDYARHVHERSHHHQVYRHFVPRFDLEQHDDSYELYGELPGFRREDIIIETGDDRSLQVSGSISDITSRTLAAPGEQNRPPSTKGPTTESPDQRVSNGTAPKVREPEPAVAIRKPASDATVPAPPPPKKNPDLLEATTTNQERYLDARFGDVLDPHAEFLRGQDESKPKPSPAAAVAAATAAAESSSSSSSSAPKVRNLISERHASSFHRAFHFPTPIRKDQVTATMQDGVLHVTAPRAPMPPPVKVKVHVTNDPYFFSPVFF